MSPDQLSKQALIFGVDGQDGSYLGELLLEKGYKVVGWVPEGGVLKQENLSGRLLSIPILEGTLDNKEEIVRIFHEFRPDEIYNLASPSFAAGSWEKPELVAEVTGVGVLRILEALTQVNPHGRFFQASSSEVFGDPVESPQNEKTPFRPRNPYGIAKAFAHQTVAAYRSYYGVFAVSGILFNHESPRRPKQFVTRKITDGAVRIYYGLQSKLVLGDLDAERDWSYAGDIVRAMWLMLQNDTPHDYVIGSGSTQSVREACEIAFSYLGLDYSHYVVSDERFYRPREQIQLRADTSEIFSHLGWRTEIPFQKMIEMMVEADLLKLRVEGNTGKKTGT